MESVGMLSLPNEVLLTISRYLPLGDLFSFSITCHRLRSLLNHDFVWERFLNIEYLTPYDLLFRPTVHRSLQNALSPVCSNKQHVIRKVRLLNNWNYGRCTYHVIQDDYGSLNQGRRSLVSEMSMYADNFVFLLAKFHHSCAVELWNIRGNPILLTDIQLHLVHMLQVVGDNLVIFVDHRIYVHNICIESKALPIKYVLKTTNLDIALSSTSNVSGIDAFNELQLCNSWNHSIHKEFLISSNKSKLLIWNIEKSLKVFTYNLPNVSQIDVEVDYSYATNVLLKTFCSCSNQVLEYESKTFHIVNIFQKRLLDLKQLKIVPDHIVLQGSYIVAFSYKSANSSFEMDLICSVYNIETFKLLNKKLFTIGKTGNCMKTKIVNNCFALLCMESNLKVVDASTLDIIHTFECNQNSGLVIVYEFNILSKLFIGTRDSSNFNVWNVERKALVPSIPFLNNEDLLISFNKWCSKVVCYDREMGTISVLNFLGWTRVTWN